MEMLINANQPEELRVALFDNNLLHDLDIENPTSVKKKANIYKGIITRIEPSLEAAFVDYGTQRQGFLPLKEICPQYYQTNSSNRSEGKEKPRIKDLVKEKQELMVQIDKEERGNKGAALTTYITLAGCYLVLMPNAPGAGGISRRIEGEEREELRTIWRNLHSQENMGVIIRTSGIGKSLEDIQWDLDVLSNQWQAIKTAYQQQSAPFLIHQEGDVIIRSIRDNLRKSITSIIIDDQETYIKAKNYIEQVNPAFISNLKLYQDKVPLFSRYQIESQIETAYQRNVLLPAGGSIVIDRTEALVTIDVNSAKATRATNIEDTALSTNLEAADEVARQLRLRDLGGLIVIDFIDMGSTRNQREVENRLREALKCDRARTQGSRISRFGLLEMSRQRLRQVLGESSQETCPRCEGQGIIRGIQSLALSMLRLLEEEALKGTHRQIQLEIPVPLSTFILNEKRDVILDIEKRHNVTLLILPNPHLETPHYKINRRSGTKTPHSHTLVTEPETTAVVVPTRPSSSDTQPAIQGITPPPRPVTKKAGLIKRLFSALSTDTQEKTVAKDKEPTKQISSKPSSGRPSQYRGRRKKNTGSSQSSNTNRQRYRGNYNKQRKAPPKDD